MALSSLKKRTVLAILMAVTAEGLVEYGSTISKAFCNGEVKTAVKQIAACVAGIVLCVLVGADFYAGIGITFKVAITGNPADWYLCVSRRELCV